MCVCVCVCVCFVGKFMVVHLNYFAMVGLLLKAKG